MLSRTRLTLEPARKNEQTITKMYHGIKRRHWRNRNGDHAGESLLCLMESNVEVTEFSDGRTTPCQRCQRDPAGCRKQSSRVWVTLNSDFNVIFFMFST